MSMTIYKSNKANQGSLFSIKFVAKSNKQGEDFKPGGFFLSIVKQVGWNEQNHVGKFSGGDSVAFKIDQFEAAKILHVLERNWNLGDISGMTDRKALAKEYGFYNMHSGKQTIHINFVPWQRKTDKEQSGFAIHVTKVADGENTTYSAAFAFGEDINLREYIKLGLEHINMAGYAEDKRRFEEGANNKRNGDSEEEAPEAPKSNKRQSTGRTRATKPAPEPESEPEETSEEASDEPLF